MVQGLGLCVVLLIVGWSSGFYLPGFRAVTYDPGFELEVYADQLSSPQDRVPFDYYHLPFCRSTEKIEKRMNHNIGEILMGERDERTAYSFLMNSGEQCKLLCEKSYTSEQIQMFSKFIKREYRVQMNVDDLPLSSYDEEFCYGEQNGNACPFSRRGVALGKVNADGDAVVLFNHIRFQVAIHKPKLSATDLHFDGGADGYRVVGFRGSVFSVDHSSATDLSCPVKEDMKPLILSTDPKGQTIRFSYDVEFVESDLEWATRFDPFLEINPELRKVQWLSIINSLAIALILAAVVATVLLRTIYIDFARYNALDDAEEVAEETGWKLLHGDVFRPPKLHALLCIAIGTGAQLCLIVTATLAFSVLGLWSPFNRGGLLTGLIFFWLCTSFVAGYVSAFAYQAFGGVQKRLVTTGTALFFPGLSFAVFFLLDIAFSLVHSSKAVFWTLLLLLFFWFVISVPLTIIGSFLGYKVTKYEPPCKTNSIARPIPNARSPLMDGVIIVLGGLLPFGAVFIELVFIMNSLWQDDMFAMFSFLSVVCLIVAITCAELSIVMTYLFFVNEDYRWWWRSFFSPASSGLYVFLYSIVYLAMHPNLRGMHILSLCVYLGYMFLISLGFMMATGFIGVSTSFLFVHKMFSAVRVD